MSMCESQDCWNGLEWSERTEKRCPEHTAKMTLVALMLGRALGWQKWVNVIPHLLLDSGTCLWGRSMEKDALAVGNRCKQGQKQRVGECSAWSQVERSLAFSTTKEEGILHFSQPPSLQWDLCYDKTKFLIKKVSKTSISIFQRP